jgi:hypothetical protein
LLFWNLGEMKTKSKKIINFAIKLVFIFSIIFLSLSLCLICARMGFGLKLEHPLCWASFLQIGILFLGFWAFNKELLYY